MRWFKNRELVVPVDFSDESFSAVDTALEADAIPHLGHRPQLADLLHEADAGVDEERDRADHRREPVNL